MRACDLISETPIERDNRLIDNGWINPFKEKWSRGRPSLEKRMRKDFYFIWLSFQLEKQIEMSKALINSTYNCRHTWNRKSA